LENEKSISFNSISSFHIEDNHLKIIVKNGLKFIFKLDDLKDEDIEKVKEILEVNTCSYH